MKPFLYTKFGMINRSMEVVFCLYEKYEKLLFCVTLVKRSINDTYHGVVSKSRHATSYICMIFNCSLTSGIFPDDLKCAKVTHLFKQGKLNDVNDYRPISVISVVAKVFEQITYNQLDAYLSENNLISQYQSGFRSMHSTVTSSVEATDNWALNTDRKVGNCKQTCVEHG